MLIIDSSCLYEVLTFGERAESIRSQMANDPDHGAPHLIDVEVLGVIRRESLRGNLDPTASHLARRDLARWPGQRFDHRPLLERAWELRHNVRTADAMFVALAEILRAPLLTLDEPLSQVSGLRCEIELY